MRRKCIDRIFQGLSKVHDCLKAGNLGCTRACRQNYMMALTKDLDSRLFLDPIETEPWKYHTFQEMCTVVRDVQTMNIKEGNPVSFPVLDYIEETCPLPIDAPQSFYCL